MSPPDRDRGPNKYQISHCSSNSEPLRIHIPPNWPHSFLVPAPFVRCTWRLGLDLQYAPVLARGTESSSKNTYLPNIHNTIVVGKRRPASPHHHPGIPGTSASGHPFAVENPGFPHPGTNHPPTRPSPSLSHPHLPRPCRPSFARPHLGVPPASSVSLAIITPCSADASRPRRGTFTRGASPRL
jgi:hypothetical protein